MIDWVGIACHPRCVKKHLLVTVAGALMLGGWLVCRHGPDYLAGIFRLFWRKLRFWLLAGGVGFGLFYACLCFAADHAPAWITAATYQLTILATPFVLRAFGKRVPLHGIAFLVLIFFGILALIRGVRQSAPPIGVIA